MTLRGYLQKLLNDKYFRRRRTRAAPTRQLLEMLQTVKLYRPNLVSGLLF